jgi:hypothetical protein
MANNTQVTAGTGDVIRDIDHSGVKTQVVGIDTNIGGAESLMTMTNGLPSNIVNSTFVFSANGTNSSTTQLAAGATFTGAIEANANFVNVSLLLIIDQPWTLTVKFYIDVSGDFSQAGPAIVFTGVGGVGGGLNVCLPNNGNYTQVLLTNAGGAATTLLNLNTAYGNLLPVQNNLGNQPVSLADVGGVPLSVTAGLPVNVINTAATNNSQLIAAQTAEGALAHFLVGAPDGDYAGLPILEQVIDPSTGLQLQVNVANQPKVDQLGNGGVIPADMQGPWVVQGGMAQIFTTDNYQSLSIESLSGVVTVTQGNTLSTLRTVNNVLNTGTATLGSTISSAGFGVMPATCRYVKVSVAAAAGNGATVYLRQQPCPLWLNTTGLIANLAQIAGITTVTAGVNGTLSVGGNAAEGVNLGTNPIPGGAKVRTAALTALSAGQISALTASSGGALVTFPYSVPDLSWQASSGITPLATTTSTQLVAAAGAGFRNYCSGLQLYNTSATVSTNISILDNATVIWTGFLPATTAALPVVDLEVVFNTPLRAITANQTMSIQCGTTGASVYYNVQGFSAP